ncbi:exopolyphosphatase, partial [Corynebacterium sp. UMB4614]|nr:exopolyphosphatase [Corynebacterium sp. UMB4614]
MKRIAAVDCGTNSLRLLVSDVGDGDIRQVTRTMEIIRLGEGVDETGRISPEAIERARVVLQNYTDHMTREN